MRLHGSSAGLDPGGLVPGEDLVLTLHEPHGIDLRDGVLAHDHLDMDGRRGVDLAAVQAVEEWRDRYGSALTLDGVNLAEIWELMILDSVLPAVRDAAGLRRAIEAYSCRVLEVTDGDSRTHLIALAAAEPAGIEVRVVPAGVDAAKEGAGSARRRPSGIGRLGHLPLALLEGTGFPSRMHRDAVLFLSYWPLMPFFDRLLLEGGRPAISLRSRPTGPARSLKALPRGGFLGRPGATARRRSRRRVLAAVQALRATPSSQEVLGLDLGPCIHEITLDIVEGGALDDLAWAATARRAFRRSPPRALLTAYDLEPGARLFVTLANEAGIRTIALAHGAYLLPQPLADLDICDEALLWSHAIAPPITRWDRPVHLVGYPLPHDPPSTKRRPAAEIGPRIVVLGQPAAGTNALIDRRITVRHYAAAIAAVHRVLPDAEIIVRPHPAEDRASALAAMARSPSANLRLDPSTAILELFESCDLCIGGMSTATLQTALVGTPLIVLNLSGYDWPAPIGGDTSVPVADSEASLGSLLRRWADGEPWPGREDLLDGLGAHGEDASDRLLAVV